MYGALRTLLVLYNSVYCEPTMCEMWIYVCVYIYISLYICVYIYHYMCVYIIIYICVCVYIYNVTNIVILLLFFWVIIQAGINFIFLKVPLLQGCMQSLGFCNSFIGLPQANSDRIGFRAAPGVTVSHCPCFAAVDWAHQMQCWSSTAETLLQPAWFFRGGQRSPLSISKTALCRALLFLHFTNTTISHECWLHAGLGQLQTQSHSYPHPRNQTAGSGSLSDYFLIDFKFVLQYLFWIV